VRPAERLLALHLLVDPAKLRSARAWDAGLGTMTASPEEEQLAAMLIQTTTAALDWSRYEDDTEQRLRALIEAKLAGQPPVAAQEEPVQVLQLLEALKQSVAAVTRPAKAAKTSKRLRRSA
jgi:DNA end-binding protein Ku